MGNKPKNRPESSESVMTKYDRKVEARKKQAQKERKERIIFLSCATVICICIVAIISYSAITSMAQRKKVVSEPYIKVGEHEISQLEYVYFYNYTANNYLSVYADYLSYMGLDTSKNFAEQQYSENMTWKDYFDQLTVEQIQSVKSMSDDITTNGFVYDTTEDYEKFRSDFKSKADAAKQSVSDYYKAVYGKYATAANMKPYVTEGLLVGAYMNNLLEQNKPTDEEITAYYEENKDNYDTVDYRSFTFSADLDDEATEEEIETAMEELKVKAEAMKAERESGVDFESLCVQYAKEDEKEKYESSEDEASLTQGALKSGVSSYYGDWLFDAGRNAGDITVVENESSNYYYVVEFIQRTYDESSREQISQEISNNKVIEYMDGLMANYEVTDIVGDLIYLTTEAVTEETTEEATEEVTE